jgi:hypothetical protein
LLTDQKKKRKASYADGWKKGNKKGFHNRLKKKRKTKQKKK